MNKKKYLTVALWCFTGLWVLFIWWNSTRTGSLSGGMSARVMAMFNALLQKIFPSFELSHHFVRKAALFCEFGVLAVLLCFDLYIALDLNRPDTLKGLSRVLLCVPCSMAVAVIDEFIQLL